MSTNDSLDVVCRVCEHWPEMTLDEFRALLTPDCVYLNVPLPHLKCIGPDQAHAFLGAFKENWIPLELSLIHIRGDARAVLVERVERFRKKDGEAQVELRSMGAFELRDGKIAHWRDYFDPREAAPLAG